MNNLEAAHRHWAELITEAWQKSVVAIIETGSLLAEAKAALPHGKFLQMVERDLPFEARTAQMLMAIAANPWIANHGTHLPASWRTLYELSRVEPALLDEALRSGAIKPDMKRREIKRLTAIGRFSFFIFNIDWRQQRMTEQEIAAFDLPSIATDDCMVLIHAETSEGSKRAAALLREWGFANAFSYRLTTENDPELRREVRSGCYDIQRNGPLPQHWAGAFRGDAGHDSVLWDLSCWLSLPKEMDKVRGPGLMAKAGAKELMQNGIIWISASAFSLACRIPSLPKSTTARFHQIEEMRMQDLLERLAAILELPAETVERHILMLLVPLVREMHEAEVEEDARKDALAEREAGWLRRAIARAKLRRLAPP